MSREQVTLYQKGVKVHYDAKYCKKENGIVKEQRGDIVFVVYECGGNWDYFENYTGEATDITDLKYGWI